MGIFSDVGKGLIGSAMAGGGQAAQEVDQSQIDFQNKSDLQAQYQQEEVQKQLQIDQGRALINTQTANDQRTAQAGRVNDAMSGLVNSAYGTGNPAAISDAAGGADPDTGQPMDPNDQAALTPDQLAVIQAANAGRTAMQNDPNLRLAAAAQTGDLSLDKQSDASTKVMTAEARANAIITGAGTRADASMYGADQRRGAGQDRNATLERDTDVRTGSAQKINADRLALAQKLASQKIAALNPVDKATLEQANSFNRDITNNRVQIKALTDAIAVASPGAKAALQSQVDSLNADTAMRQTKRDALLTQSSAAFQAFRATQAAQPSNFTAGTAGSPAPGGGGNSAVQSALDAWNAQPGQ